MDYYKLKREAMDRLELLMSKKIPVPKIKYVLLKEFGFSSNSVSKMIKIIEEAQ